MSQDALPLPLLAEFNILLNIDLQVASGLSRVVRRRLRRRRGLVKRANLVITALNELWGVSATGEESLTPMRARARLTILRRVALDMPSPSMPLATVNELLRMSLSYGGEMESDAAAVAPYKKRYISLPETTTGCPRAEEVLDASGQALLSSFESTMLRPDAELGWCFERQKEISPYMDVILSRDKRSYLDFVMDLWGRNLVSWRRFAACVSCPFFVWKKDGIKRRLILDCRQTNVLFRDPPKMRMASGAKLADIRLPPSAKLYIGKSDVKDFFYNIRLDGKICEYFGMPSILCCDAVRYFHEHDLPIPKELQDVVLTGRESVWPCFTAVPMGWKWAMYIAQRLHTKLCLEGSGLDSDRVMEEGVMPDVLGTTIPMILPYVDNLNVLGTSADVVDSVLFSIVHRLLSTGFTFPVKETNSMLSEKLGYEPLLSVPQHLYRFAREEPTCRPLWPSARREAFLLSQLLLFCSCNLRQEASPVVSVSDASLTGYAVCTSTWTQANWLRVSKHKERYRYRAIDPLYTKARAFALSDFGDILTDPSTVIPFEGRARSRSIGAKSHFF
eukprot:6459979-Amphidinium_carterae.3